MKRIFIIQIIFAQLGACLLMADPPGETKFDSYSELLSRSPFVIKKDEQAFVAPVINKSLSLKGVVQIDGVWRAYLVDRKDPTRTFTVDFGKDSDKSGLELVEVKQDTSNYLNTQVVLKSGGQLITVGYNAAELKSILAKAAVASNGAGRPPGSGYRGSVTTNHHPQRGGYTLENRGSTGAPPATQTNTTGQAQPPQQVPAQPTQSSGSLRPRIRPSFNRNR